MSQTQAQKDEQKKIKLENTVAKGINTLFVQLNKANTKSIAKTGNSVTAESFLSNWENLIKKHDIRVQNVFKGDVASTLPEEDQQLSDAELALFLLALIEWRDKKSQDSAQIITNTNKRQLAESMNTGRQLFADQNARMPTNKELALSTAAVFRRKYKPRVMGIAATETQSAAEATKLIEAAVLSSDNPADVMDPLAPAKVESTKTWRNTGKNIRPLHKRLSGVKKPINKSFETGGEQLMHPGDTSLGATAKNIVHCKCALTFNIDRVHTPEVVSPDLVEPKPKPKPEVTSTGKPKPISPDSNLSSKPKTKPSFKPPQKQPKAGLKVSAAEIPDIRKSIDKVGAITSTEKQYLSWYSGDGFKELNDYLRNPKIYASSPSKMQSLNKFTGSLNSAISKRKLNQNITVYRGVNSKKFTEFLGSKDLIGKKMPITSFQSATKSQSAVRAYSGIDGVEMRIKLPKGTNAIDMAGEKFTRNITEAEVLLPNKGEYIIKKISKDGKLGLKTILEVEYVQ